jgi:hypothetical protein
VAEALCDCVLVLGPGGAAYYDDIKDGIAAYAESRAAAPAAPATDQPGAAAATPLIKVGD